MSDYYPISISEARYQGVYAGGPWVLIAGVTKPREHTDAFATDVECMTFWKRVEAEGPILEIDHPYRDEPREIVAKSGDDPAQLWEWFEEEIRSYDEEYQERFDWPDVEDTDFEDYDKTDNRGLTEDDE